MSEKQRFLACRAACYRRLSVSYRRYPMATAVKLPSSRLCAYRRLAANISEIIVQKTRKGTSLSFWCKVYHALVSLCCKFERDRWSQRGASKQKLLEASGRAGAILTTVASRGCPQWPSHYNVVLIFSCDQLSSYMTGSVRPSVRPSVCHTFFTMFPSSYHHEIFRIYYHGQKWCPCKRSRSEVKGQGHRGQHPT